MKDMQEILLGVASAVQIAKAGSFRGAVRDTGTGFKTLQNHVLALEERIGLIIFHRTPDGVVLTREGQRVIEEAQKIEELLNKIIRLGKSLSNETEGEVLVSTTEGLGTFWVSPQLHFFSKLHPRISIRLHPSMSITNMRRFETDLALQVVEPIMPEIKRVRVGRLHLMLAAAPSYIEKHGEPKTVAELKNHKFVFHTNPQFSDRHRIEQAVGARLEQSQFVVMQNSSAHYMMLLQGFGIGFIPSYGFAIGVKLEPLSVPVSYPLDIWLCFHEDARSTPRIAAVIDWMTDLFDPRLFPWFKREFVFPDAFGKMTDTKETAEIMQSVSLRR
jgi:DNA-binding transcriptional LysR family regulator